MGVGGRKRESFRLTRKRRMPSEDTGRADQIPAPMSDVHGQAALLLVESLIHGLCERSILSADDAVEIAERAMDVQGELAELADGAGEPMWQSHHLLFGIARSLKADSGPVGN